MLIPDKRDRIVVRPERRTGQDQPKHRRIEGGAKRFPPVLPIACVVQLIKNEQRLLALADALKDLWSQANLLVGNHCTVIVGGLSRLIVRQCRVELQPDLSRSLGPLRAEVIGRADNQHPDRRLLRHELMRNTQRKTGFPGRRRGHRQKIFRRIATDSRQRSLLPVTKGRSPGG